MDDRFKKRLAEGGRCDTCGRKGRAGDDGSELEGVFKCWGCGHLICYMCMLLLSIDRWRSEYHCKTCGKTLGERA